MNKGTVSEDSINIYCDKHKDTFNEIYHVYHCMRSLNLNDNGVNSCIFSTEKEFLTH